MTPKKLVRISASMALSGSTNVPLCFKYLLQSSKFKLPLLAYKQRLVFNLEFCDRKQAAALTKRVLRFDRSPPVWSDGLSRVRLPRPCRRPWFEKNEGTEDAWERTGVMNGGDRRRGIYKGFHFLPVSVPLSHALSAVLRAPSHARFLELLSSSSSPEALQSVT